MAVSLTREGMMYLGSEPVGLDDLGSKFKAAAEGKRVVLHIRADEDAPYGLVARLIATAQSAGVADVRFLVAPLP